MKLKLCTLCGVAYPKASTDWELFHLKYYHILLYSQLKATATNLATLIKKTFVNDNKKEVEQIGNDKRF